MGRDVGGASGGKHELGFFKEILEEVEGDSVLGRAVRGLRHVAASGRYGWEMELSGKGEGEEGKKEEGKEDKTEEKETVAAKEAEPETGTASRKPVETEGGHDEL
ncbi:hypothetical protein HK097_005643 [Rhizophlyctis rosea]|uniref:Uncharacterized protein n=1 Tax=Rhizophlyctis rosea TaxID=64517 RepID=A0AAD5S020_9FUNG|nr:hypothetical protein HK097_005643 [Rhizophlyctis rosea]